ncbi:hypothetical protein [Paenibacillus sp. GYB003]|uniref:hypothetical protein n=1 Tax=Paenibacillus sp. GYB003 TaxID=2994392 RepID=UPI002F96170A
MSNSKDFVQNQFKKWKHAASQLISSETSGEPLDESLFVELEPDYYERCRQLAEARNTTVSAVVHYMLKQQFALQSHDRPIKSNIEQLERNPLLALDGLTGRRKNRETGGDESREFA